ncbi:hypothetical protein H113_03876 [Trichophyton rubrum MR1459]|nr:hypothetical protein H104_03838 [Trichophyton rubrum CBS 289.86]EZF95763.1 hypothetical protein H113_03876 [Trichophyton rubrum MR1459]
MPRKCNLGSERAGSGEKEDETMESLRPGSCKMVEAGIQTPASQLEQNAVQTYIVRGGARSHFIDKS